MVHTLYRGTSKTITSVAVIDCFRIGGRQACATEHAQYKNNNIEIINNFHAAAAAADTGPPASNIDTYVRGRYDTAANYQVYRCVRNGDHHQRRYDDGENRVYTCMVVP